MPGQTITSTTAEAAGTGAGSASRRPSLALSGAARELELKRGELDLAVQLGYVRTVPDEGGGGRRVTRTEIERVRSGDGGPGALRERVTTVGTRDGAALMGVTPSRFTRFARLGLLVPVTFYVNRYRAAVWLYLAQDVQQFADGEENAALLTGRMPEGLLDQLDAGLDLRPRNWRGRHLGFQLRQTEDPWAKAAVVASLLNPMQVAEIVRDPYERAQLNRLRPALARPGATDSPSALTAARIMTAEDPDEIGWLRADLTQALIEARRHRPASRPSPGVPEERPPETAHVRGNTALPGGTAVHGTTAVRRSTAPHGATAGRQAVRGAGSTPAREEARAPGPLLARHAPAVRHQPIRPRGMLGWLRRRNP